LPSFGENLRREREKRSITLDQISQSTKIGTRMLQALEADKFSQLPGGIFNKGFVRAYARHVGLDEEQTVAEYLQASGEVPSVPPELPEPQQVRGIEASAQPQPPRPLPWGVFAAILLLVALALSIWSHRQKKHEGTTPQSPPVAPAAQPSTEDRPAQTSALPPSVAPVASDKISNTSLPISSTVNQAAQVTPANPPGTTPAAIARSSPAESPVFPRPDEFTVVVQAQQASWTTIKADGRTVYSGILSAGDQHAALGRKEVIVRTGNVGGINLRFNGKKLDPQGELGQVRTITFGPSGIVSNTSAPSPIQ